MGTDADPPRPQRDEDYQQVPVTQGSLRAAAERGAMWTGIGRWGAQAAALVTFVVVARNVPKPEVGLAAVTLSILVLLQVLADAGIGTYLVQGRRTGERSLSTAFWTTLILSAFLAVCLIALAPLIETVLSVRGLSSTVPWISISLLSLGAAVVPTAMLEQRLQFRSLAVRSLLGTFCGALAALILAIGGAGVWALIVQSIVQQVVALTTVFVTVQWRPTLTFDTRQFHGMMSFGSKSASIATLTHIRERLEDFLLGAFLGAGAVGTWSVASRTTRLIFDLTNSVIQAISLPLLAQMSTDRARMDRNFSRMLGVSLSVVTPALAVAALVTPDLFPAILGSKWNSAIIPAQLIAVSSIVAAVSFYDRTYYLAVGRPGVELTMTIGLVVVAVALTALSAPYGPVTLAAVALARTLVFVPLRVLVLMRTCHVKFEVFRQPLATAMASIGVGNIVYWTADILSLGPGVSPAAAKGTVFVVFYLFALRWLAPDTFRDFSSTLYRLLARVAAR